MKSVMLNANNDGGLESRLQAALDIARAFDSHLSCVQVIPFQVMVTGEVFVPAYGAADLYDKLVEQGQQHQAQMEDRLRLENVPWDWLRCDGDAAQAIIDRSGLIDLIVISTANGDVSSRNGDLGAAGAICINARGPILAVPQKAKSFDPLGTALVAWNGSVESANAVRLALPMLAKASGVQILTVSEDTNGFPPTEACEYLSRHGIRAELHPQVRRATTLAGAVAAERTADLIMGAARSLEADYIVAGAYGHSRFREAVFGGVTRDLLTKSEVPLLLAH